MSPLELPKFVNDLRKVNGRHFTPLTYVNHVDGIPYVIAAQWLYVPHFVKYRDGFFHSEEPQGPGKETLQILEDWYRKHCGPGDIRWLEGSLNTHTLWSVFGCGDIVPYDDDGNFTVMAKTLARMWHALLRVEFPERRFRIEIFDNDEYGPQVTFSGRDPEERADQVTYEGPCDHRGSRATSPADFPWFANELREVNGPRFTALTYINMDEAIPYVIAAQWLYVPRFVEYRGGLFRAVHPGGLVEENLGTLDDWFDAYDGDVSSVERTVNTLSLWDLFAGNDIGPYEDDLLPMAMTIARAWDALLRVEFPDREFEVKVLDSEAYGPQVTFSSGQPSGAWVPKVTEYAINRNLDGSVRGTSENGITRPATPDEIP